MKKLFFLFAIVVLGTSLNAQSKIGLQQNILSVSIDQSTRAEKQTENSNEFNKIKRSAFWSEDFSNGFTGQGNNGEWTQFGTANPTTGIIPKWEYRGSTTTPDTAVGSRGSCSSRMVPIASNTAANGFIIFDSNYWDEPFPDSCLGIGTGLSPRPHRSALVSPSIDLSGHPTAQLFFTTYARNFQAELNIYTITDGDTTFVIDLYKHLELTSNTNTKENEPISIEISEMAGGKSDVKIMWEFVGDYYYFMMDDVFIGEVPKYDYSIYRVTNDNITTGFEYYNLPLRQTHLLQPGVSIKSRGTEVVDLTIVITITEPDGIVKGPFSKTITNFPRDTTPILYYVDTYIPTKYGIHTIDYKITSPNDALDFDPSKNTTTRSFNLSPNKWSDVFSDKAVSYPAPKVNGMPGVSEAIQLFNTYSDVGIFGIDFIIINAKRSPDEATFEGDEIKLTLYEVDKEAYETSINSGALLKKEEILNEITSVKLIVDSSMVGEFDKIHVERAIFNSPTFFGVNKLFAVSISNSGNGYLRIATTYPSVNSDGSGLVRGKGILYAPLNASDDDLLQLSNINPWLRVLTDYPFGINENKNLPKIGNAMPNPAKGIVSIPYTLVNNSDVTFTLIDPSGKVILVQKEGTKNVGSNTVTFDVSTIESGVYFYSLTINGAAFTKKLVVSK